MDRAVPSGFEGWTYSPEYLRGIFGVIDGLEAASVQLRTSIRMLEVTHKLFPLPTPKYQKLRKLLNTACVAIQQSYPLAPCKHCVLEGEDPYYCTRCWGRGYAIK